MQYTVKQLRDKLQCLPDDTLVCIERVEDVYFEKCGWTTKRVVFEEVDGKPYDYNDYFLANSSCFLKEENHLVILAHY